MKGIDALNRTILLCRDYVADQLSDEEIVEAFQTARVLCVADAGTLSCHSGQTALVTLVSLLSRMGMKIGLGIPDVDLLLPQPPLAGGRIKTALTLASKRMMIDAAIVPADALPSPDVVFVLGAPEIDYGPVPTWRMCAAEWSGSIQPSGASTAETWAGNWPIGGMVSALLAANEAFKCVMRRLRLRQRSDEIFFEPAQTCSWDFGPLPIPRSHLNFGRVDFISGGAISQAALYALARLPHIEMRGRIFDDDLTGLSNLNRNMLTMREDVDTRKVDVIAARCATRFEVEPIPMRFIYNAGPDTELTSRVIVGVDHIPSRWAAQCGAPGWVGVAGTSHFSISSSSHDVGQPCSGCLHPVDDPGGLNPIPTISFVSFWAGLAVAVRLIREVLGEPYPADRQHLWLTPLRLDQTRATIWSPVPALQSCPVRCHASRRTA